MVLIVRSLCEGEQHTCLNSANVVRQAIFLNEAVHREA